MAQLPNEMKSPSRFRDLPGRFLSALVMAPVGYYIVTAHHPVAYALIALLLCVIVGEWFCVVFGKSLLKSKRAPSIYDEKLTLRFVVALLTFAAIIAGGAAFSDLILSAPTALTAALVMTVICADTGAYISGKTIGGVKLCPAISPNKTVAGLIGGLIGGMLGGFFTFLFFGGTANFASHLPLFLIVAVFAQAGDLWESYFKRVFAVKDSGFFIPGHGGFLDRLDGLLFASLAARGLCAQFLKVSA